MQQKAIPTSLSYQTLVEELGLPKRKPHRKRPKDYKDQLVHRKGWKDSYPRWHIAIIRDTYGSVAAYERWLEADQLRRRSKDKARRGNLLLQRMQRQSKDGHIACDYCGFSNPDALTTGKDEKSGVRCWNCVFIRSGRGHDYPLKREVFAHYVPFITKPNGWPIYVDYVADGKVVRKYVCPNCEFTIFTPNPVVCPKCKGRLREKRRCAMCPCSDMRALSLDHVDGGGRDHLRSIGLDPDKHVSSEFYQYLKDHGYPQTPRLQVLCMNCQMIKEHQTLEWA